MSDPTSDPTLRLAVIIASTREGRRGTGVAAWFADHVAARREFALDVIDLAAIRLPTVIGGRADPAVAELCAGLSAADAFAIVTPEYNHGYPAALKHAIDLAGSEWHAKPVGFVSYGGMSGGLRAVEQLRQVFAELHAVSVRDVVSLHNPWESFDGDGRFHSTPAADAAASVLLDRLRWWGETLRDARRIRPYVA